MILPENTTVTQNIAARKNAKHVFILCLLIALPLSIYFIFFSGDGSEGISNHGHFALSLAVIFGFLSAFLFMGITFFSARSGHDDQPNYRELVEKHRNQGRK